MIKGHPIGQLCIVTAPTSAAAGRECTVTSAPFLADSPECAKRIRGEIVQHVELSGGERPQDIIEGYNWPSIWAFPPRYLLPIGHDPDALDAPEERPKETPRELQEVDA